MTGGDASATLVARCVLAEVEPHALGRVNYHEHLFQASRLLVGDELDDEARSTDEARSLRPSGFESMVDATPIGLGRDPAATARASANAGLHIVASTGAHREAHYDPGHWLLQATTAELARRFE